MSTTPSKLFLSTSTLSTSANSQSTPIYPISAAPSLRYFELLNLDPDQTIDSTDPSLTSFNRQDFQTKAKCSLCSTVFQYENDSATLTLLNQHLKTEHRDIWTKAIEEFVTLDNEEKLENQDNDEGGDREDQLNDNNHDDEDGQNHFEDGVGGRLSLGRRVPTGTHAFCWKYFQLTGDGVLEMKCDMCGKVVKRAGSSTTVANSHLKAKHPEIWERYIEVSLQNMKRKREVETDSVSVKSVKSHVNVIPAVKHQSIVKCVTSDLSDTLQMQLKYPKVATLRDFGKRLSFRGVIETVFCVDDCSALMKAVSQPGRGKVLIVNGTGSLSYALVDEKIARMAVENHWEGLLINGCVRNASVLRCLDIGIKAIGTIPLQARSGSQGSQGVDLEVFGVVIYPNEYLIADDDGVVVGNTELLNGDVHHMKRLNVA